MAMDAGRTNRRRIASHSQACQSYLHTWFHESSDRCAGAQRISKHPVEDPGKQFGRAAPNSGLSTFFKQKVNIMKLPASHGLDSGSEIGERLATGNKFCEGDFEN